MQKADYLSDPDVQAFAAWMAGHLREESTLRHRYQLARSRRAVEFGNLTGAYEQYRWPERVREDAAASTSFAANKRILDDLKTRLRAAVFDTPDDNLSLQACIEVMRWGGVVAHNVDWLRSQRTGLATHLRGVATLLASDDDATAEFLGIARFNAGMTKVYSLLLDQFVIYDSRVAAALAWFVLQWTYERGLPSIPVGLRFPCMPAKEAATAIVKKVRNPGSGQFEFPAMANVAARHAAWNVRANWLLETVLRLAGDTPFGRDANAMRRLEAALFMWGYDLGPNPPRPPLATAA